MIKSYCELIKIPTLKGRFDYLNLHGKIGDRTFGGYRCLNQVLYHGNPLWDSTRDKVIVRDNGCLFGLKDFPIQGIIIVHHMNPITIDDVLNGNPKVYALDNLISVSFDVHNGIHFGDESCLPYELVTRKPNDTCLWKNGGGNYI